MDLKLPALNFPHYTFRIKKQQEAFVIFDPVRKKWVTLTPEEWVRQHVLKYLEQKKYPLSLCAVEKKITLHNTEKRCDIVVYNKHVQPVLIIECKEPAQAITQEVFDQAVRYNMALETDLFMLTNGIQHFLCRVNRTSQSFEFLSELPECNWQ